ncbi:DUF6452 family protein [Flavobacterium terrisoli]|uniref:DUF6452 family protein n=1 Tax=Flavobacterium terrisoli TaxID=3242195 RepID=UPI002543294B|nr:DUF6452 family protein [Flavobacterium buctense]
MKKILLLLLIAISFSGCEKDDICVDDTTPRLVLEFYNASNPADLKNVTNLKVNGEGSVGGIDLGVFTGVSKIYLPLKTNAETTKYSLTNNSTTSATNQDFLEFNYARNEVYVSRACGFKTIFELNSPGGVVHTDAATPDLEWIESISIQTTNIDTENEVHIKIYF